MQKTEQRVVKFIKTHSGRKYWYLVPRAQYWNKQNIIELQQVLIWMDKLRYARIKDIPGYQLEMGADGFDPNELVLREWDQSLQLKIFDRMVAKGIIAPVSSGATVNDKLANLRNHFNLIKKLGFGYRNKEGKLFISDVGKEVINSDPEQVGDLIERQLLRIQFHNPSLTTEGYETFEIFPYLFTLRLLRELPDHALTTEEFYLFVAHAENADQLGEIADAVAFYRSLARDDQLKLRRLAKPTTPIRANASVHLGLFGVTPTLSFAESTLSVGDNARLTYLVDRYEPKLQYVDYARFEDWYSYIGSTEERISIRDIVQYYTEMGLGDEARKLVEEVRLEEEVPEEQKTLEELLEELFSEKLLEDALEKRPGLVEDGLQLVKNGRQYPTDVGPIDLLTKDEGGKFVVVELKKGQTEDKVMGQTLRYMGWVRLYLSPTALVRGIIVGRDVSDKLKAAVVGMQHAPPIVQLRQFSLKVGGSIQEIKAVAPTP